jgi:hypothetical protein
MLCFGEQIRPEGIIFLKRLATKDFLICNEEQQVVIFMVSL